MRLLWSGSVTHFPKVLSRIAPAISGLGSPSLPPFRPFQGVDTSNGRRGPERLTWPSVLDHDLDVVYMTTKERYMYSLEVDVSVRTVWPLD